MRHLKLYALAAIAFAAASLCLTAAPAHALSLGGLEETWIVTVFRRGGPVMIMILISSIIAMAISLERFSSLRRGRMFNNGFLLEIMKLASRGEFEMAIKMCKSSDMAMSRIAQAGLLRGRYGVLEVERAIESAGAHEATLLQTNLRGLGVIGMLAPMLGLLGTVTGMINAFNAISLEGVGNPSVVAAGIAEALLNTAAGIIVAIFALAAYHYFQGRVDRLVYEMEETSLQFVEEIMHAAEAAKKGANAADRANEV